MKRIYLDYASLTPIDRRVVAEMKKYSGMEYANPSSLYKEGVAAKKAMDESRKEIAGCIHAHADEIYFTSGGTEANGLALEGAGRAAHRNGIQKPHIIISAIEHSSVMETVNMLEKHGVEVTRLPVNANGQINVDELRKAIKPTTYLVSIMTVNNEIGSIQPIREIAKAVRWARNHVTKTQYPLFHTDAAQAPLFNDLNVEQLGVDLMTLDASKMYGPRGTGMLYVKRNTPIEQIMYGGGQEKNLRSGTENLPAIRGFAKAFELANTEKQKESMRVKELKDYFVKELLCIHPGIKIHGENSPSFSPFILNVSIPGIDNEFFILQLDAKGIAASTKSSCLRDADESYVLQAIGADSKVSVRFSMGRWTKKSHIRRTIAIIKAILAKKPQI